MANTEQIEQCVTLLTQIANRQGVQDWRTNINKRVKYLNPFSGEAGTLPSFIEGVEQILSEYTGHANEVFPVIYTSKITGTAKNFLNTEPPTDWQTCKERLKIHYRPRKNQLNIMQDICNIKVISIIQLLDKIQSVIDGVSECAAFNENSAEIKSSLYSILILKIKEITAGALAAEINNLYSLSAVRSILHKYVGQDKYNLHIDTSYQSKNLNCNKPNFPKNFYKQNNHFNQNQANQSNNSRQYRFQGPPRQSQQFRQYNFSGSEQQRGVPRGTENSQNRFHREFSNQYRQQNFSGPRSNQQRPVPMDVDNLHSNESTNNIEEHDFFIN